MARFLVDIVPKDDDSVVEETVEVEAENISEAREVAMQDWDDDLYKTGDVEELEDA